MNQTIAAVIVWARRNIILAAGAVVGGIVLLASGNILIAGAIAGVSAAVNYWRTHKQA